MRNLEPSDEVAFATNYHQPSQPSPWFLFTCLISAAVVSMLVLSSVLECYVGIERLFPRADTTSAEISRPALGSRTVFWGCRANALERDLAVSSQSDAEEVLASRPSDGGALCAQRALAEEFGRCLTRPLRKSCSRRLILSRAFERVPQRPAPASLGS